MQLSQLPNAISLFRFVLVPVLILTLKEGNYTAALLVFLVAGISDALDGFIARRMGFVTQLGGVLDPAADKLLMVSAYVMLTFIGHIPFWLMLAVVFRDLLIVGGYLVVTSVVGAIKMRPSIMSKLNTVAQIVLVIAVLGEQAAGIDYPVARQALIYMVLATTLISGGHYFWLWIMRRDIEPTSPKNE